MQNGYVTDKAYLGITGGTVTQQMQMQYNLPTSSGVYVYSVEQDGAAAQSDLRAGDIIVKLGDTEISSMTDLMTAKKSYKAGDSAKMTVNRSGLPMSIGSYERKTVMKVPKRCFFIAPALRPEGIWASC